MNKYHNENHNEESRLNKNRELYNNVKEEDFDKLTLTSNISIIDADTTNLDIEKLKSLLDEKYSKPTKNSKAIDEMEEEIISTKDDMEDTKEYDLKKVIDEAHKNKTSDYDRERFKKLRDTQFDILNSLNLSRTDEPIIEESLTVEEANLMNLIKTVNENSLKREQISLNETGLLSDLQGDDDTDALAPMNFDDDTLTNGKKPTLLEELEKTKQLSKKDIMDTLEKEEENTKNSEENVEINSELLETSDYEENDEPEDFDAQEKFYTGKHQINEKDLEEFADLQKEISSGGAMIKILVALLILIVLAVGVFLVNKYLDLGLF